MLDGRGHHIVSDHFVRFSPEPLFWYHSMTTTYQLVFQDYLDIQFQSEQKILRDLRKKRQSGVILEQSLKTGTERNLTNGQSHPSDSFLISIRTDYVKSCI
jgi:hypothetical protein